VNLTPSEWISRYLDDEMSEAELVEFHEWLRTPEHAALFARASLLHDRIRSELLAADVVPSQSVAPQPAVRRSRAFKMWGAALASLLVLVAVWIGFGDSPVSAATELNQLIAVQIQGVDRTYRIDVEEVAIPRPNHSSLETGRPPKPSLDGAILHVRHGNQFVLIRQPPGESPFITGSNGQTSWAIKPDGSVRFSQDLTRFNRDLPGHEHDMPLINLEEGLSQLKAAYEIQLLPVEDTKAGANDEATRLLVAVKKRGVRGPQRVEITYAVESRHIRQLRFVEMPYGPERVTLRMTLLEEQNRAAGFFDHAAHHAPDRHAQEE
jgi:hypothetical protein